MWTLYILVMLYSDAFQWNKTYIVSRKKKGKEKGNTTKWPYTKFIMYRCELWCERSHSWFMPAPKETEVGVLHDDVEFCSATVRFQRLPTVGDETRSTSRGASTHVIPEFLGTKIAMPALRQTSSIPCWNAGHHDKSVSLVRSTFVRFFLSATKMVVSATQFAPVFSLSRILSDVQSPYNRSRGGVWIIILGGYKFWGSEDAGAERKFDFLRPETSGEFANWVIVQVCVGLSNFSLSCWIGSIGLFAMFQWWIQLIAWCRCQLFSIQRWFGVWGCQWSSLHFRQAVDLNPWTFLCIFHRFKPLSAIINHTATLSAISLTEVVICTFDS